MTQDYKNVIGNEFILVITKKVRIMMFEEYRNVIGNKIILVITRKATTK